MGVVEEERVVVEYFFQILFKDSNMYFVWRNQVEDRNIKKVWDTYPYDY